MNSRVNFFFNNESKWHQEFQLLRSVILECGLTETLKWGQPCYVFHDKNIVLIHGFKDYCALLFFKGALLKDSKKILVQQTENVQVARQIRFTGWRQIEKLSSTIKAYVFEAIEIEKAGVKAPLKKTSEFKLPDEFKTALSADNQLKKAFDALTPGRQRAYLLHFASAKQQKTREARIEKYRKQILAGKGLDD